MKIKHQPVRLSAVESWLLPLVAIASVFSGGYAVANQTQTLDLRQKESSQQEELRNWVIVNDGVMGGVSSSRLQPTVTGFQFSGELSLANNGGFASTRRVYSPVPWQSDAPLTLSVQGDGRQYQFRLRTNRGYDGIAYSARFDTLDGQQSVIVFEQGDFVPVWRGRRVLGAPKLDFAEVAQLGFMLADKQPGPFALTITSISQ